jgi:signal transduction histidine kinase
MKRLYTRLYFHFVGVLLVVGAAVSFVFATGWRAHFVRGSALKLSGHVASLIADRLDDPAARERAVRRFADELDIDITVRDTAGGVLATSGPTLPALAPEDAARARAEPIIVGMPGRRPWFAVAPVRSRSGADRGVVEVSLQRRFHVRHEMRPLAALVLVLLIVAVATAPLARRISRPVERLTEATRRLGGGELGYRVELPGAGWHRPRRPDELEDLTRAWNEMADRIERLVRGHKELLANVSHELRSPLARIRVALELLPRDAEGEARLRDVETDLAELDQLIDDVLTASRLEAGALPAHLDTVDLPAIFEQLRGRAANDPDVAGRAVVVAPVPAGLPPLVADGALLRRALWNLVENAAKYGAPPIAVAAADAGRDGIALSVADDGAGISAADRERVLEPFYRVDKARTPGAAGERPRGFGLGLTLARRIAEVHGGRITVEPARVDSGVERGCRVTLLLPATRVASPEA